MKTKNRLTYKKERVVLSDILPFEIPITFSNRHLYDFLVSNKVVFDTNKIKWKTSNHAFEETIKLLFDLRNKPVANNEISIDKNDLRTIPFSYKIAHKENDFRELTVIHPKNQLQLIDFYEKYSQLILYYCSLSPFSIRKAYKIASYTYYKDYIHQIRLSRSQESEIIEQYDKEYENLKTFFVYKNYSNVHKFYESYKYHRCEKKYNKLFRFDISKCFDSIYSHTISWALLNKAIVKEYISLSKSTFSGKFDTIMQDLNYGETNGIVIGPEFSRIFAELILQNIDKMVESALFQKEKLRHKTDYEIFRYVDDYFVFYNEDKTKDKILEAFRLQLKEYKLYINDAKTFFYNKPIITEITIAKQRITELFDLHLVYKINKRKNEPAEENINIETKEDHELHISSNELITKFKTVIKESNIQYSEILNYTLALIERKIAKILIEYQKLVKSKETEENLIRGLLEILDFTFFIYSVSPRVNTTIRLCRILSRLTEFVSSKDRCNLDFKHLIFKKIYDNIYFILQKNKSVEHTQVETLYLLISLRELGKEYWLNIDTLCSYVNIRKNESGKLILDGSLNYFAIVVLLFYINDKKRYVQLKEFIKDQIFNKIEKVGSDIRGKHAELVLLLFDTIACPFLEYEFKQKLLSLFGVDDPVLQSDIVKLRPYWFTKWTDFRFGKELDAKQSQEVY
jgi:hypothetical protein